MQQGILNMSLAAMISNMTIASWPELIAPHRSPNVHIEYHRHAPKQSVHYLKMWATERRGEWRLVCQYWTASANHGSVQGVTFCPPFYSASFAHLLTAVLENQGTFSDLEDQTRGVLLQISTPNAEERTLALSAVQTALADRGICDRESGVE
jgi:hypothetical protein